MFLACLLLIKCSAILFSLAVGHFITQPNVDYLKIRWVSSGQVRKNTVMVVLTKDKINKLYLSITSIQESISVRVTIFPLIRAPSAY